MEEHLQKLQESLEAEGYEIGDVIQNRSQVRIVLLEEGASASDLRAIVTNVIDEDEILGVNVSSESVEGQDGMNTVVSFRQRS